MDKRYLFVALFFILAIISIVVQNKVTINYDITKYLPNTSEMKKGLSIMEEEFKNDDGILNIMFKGLKENEKETIKKELQNFDHVNKVEYREESSNQKEYTLYTVSVDGKDKKVGDQVYQKIMDQYENYHVSTSGNIAERNKAVLPMYVVVIAVLSALVILIIMSSSYVEPFLFLFSILIAVALNKGTNLFLGEVSNITDSISAILQMALSMDYSIMLMNRYNQEKQVEKDNKQAMKKALHHSFKSISSSSLTTIVGLLALVFMSFTIGKDLGIVLAKGVLFSLVSIFFVLPGLILIFDRWIEKTKKKSISPKLDKVAHMSFRCRYVALGLFVVAFIVSFLLKGNLSILYTDSSEDEIKNHFKENNQIAILYKNKEEEKIKDYCKNLKKESNKISEVLCYNNTINEPLTYDHVNQKIKELGVDDFEIEEYLLKIIYFNYFNNEVKSKMSINELVNIVQNDLYEKSDVEIDDNIKKSMEKLSNFSSKENLEKTRTKEELARLLGINDDTMNNLFIYYFSLYQNNRMTLNEFITFMTEKVFVNNEYAQSVDEKTKESITLLNHLLKENRINTKMTKESLRDLLTIDQEKLDYLWLYYLNKSEIVETLSIHEWTNFVLTNIVTNPLYQNNFDEKTIEQIKIANQFSNREWIETQKNSQELSAITKIEEDTIKQILFLKYSEIDNQNKMTVKDWVDGMMELKANTNYLEHVDTTILKNIPPELMASDQTYDATSLAQILNIEKSLMYKTYALIDLYYDNTDAWTMTPYELFVTMMNNDEIKNKLEQDTKTQLMLLIEMMDSTKKNKRYSYQEMKIMLNMPVDKMKLTYALYISATDKLKLTPKELINFLLENQNDEMLKPYIDNNFVLSLTKLNHVINKVEENQKYDSLSLSNLLGIEKEKLDFVYSLYFSDHENQTMSLYRLIDFINKDVLTSDRYAQTIDLASQEKLRALNSLMLSVMNDTKHSKEEMYHLLSKLENSVSKEKIELIYIYNGSKKELDKSQKLTIEGLVTYVNDDLLKDERFLEWIDPEKQTKITEAKNLIDEAKKQLVGTNYSRIIINSTLDLESDETINTIKKLKQDLKKEEIDAYVVGDSLLAVEMSETFDGELNFITVLTMLAIFLVVAISFKSLIIPFILVMIIQCSIYMTMGILSFANEGVYFIALLIVQSILMGATIDYAIVYTSYYIESRKTYGIKESIRNAYNKSIHTILTSSSILIIVTLIVALFSSQIASKICETLSEGTICSTVLILLLLPGIVSVFDRWIIKKNQKM